MEINKSLITTLLTKRNSASNPHSCHFERSEKSPNPPLPTHFYFHKLPSLPNNHGSWVFHHKIKKDPEEFSGP